uniref:ETFB lysine methyltransferase n=1 Tax=Anthurium amnicola TaxID=1678845 RepID=A0A1D1YX18_9ARAE
MSPPRCASRGLRSLVRLFSLRPSPASSFPTSTASPTGSNREQLGCCWASNLLPPLSLPPSATREGRAAGSRGACSLPPKRRRQRAAELRNTRACSLHEELDGARDPSLSRPCVSVCIRCFKRDADTLSEALLWFGASSASMDELSDFDDTDQICITSIFTDDQHVQMCISNAAKSIGLKETPSYEVTVSEQFNWIRNVQETFHPLQITNGLWVVPEWRTPPDIQATNIILNPGVAFGTGEHPTTKLCLLLLHGSIKGGESFLDYGTGSGILGIAAVKMGAALSVGIDIDPQALSSARQNIALNEIEHGRMILYLAPQKDSTGEQTYNCEIRARKQKFDIIIANILLNPLLELAESLVSYGKPGALIGVSGIISEQVPEVKERFLKNLESISISEMDGWACLTGFKRSTCET